MTQPAQHTKVRDALAELRVHVRVSDQKLGPDDAGLKRLVSRVPALIPFGASDYVHVWAVLDWDHRLPSKQLFLRIHAAYTEAKWEEIQALRDAVDDRIASDNLYPEFDLPDYSDIVSDEAYLCTYDASSGELGEMQFSSPWRRQVPNDQVQVAREVLEGNKIYQKAFRGRQDSSLGPAMMVGWVPPCAAKASSWALEFWLVTRFDGAAGEAHVFMVDPESKALTHDYHAEVQAS